MRLTRLLAAALSLCLHTIPSANAASYRWPASLLTEPATTADASAARPLIALRFPALILPEDLAAFQADYGNKYGKQGHHPSAFPMEPLVFPNAGQMMLIKSTYHGMRLGKCVQENGARQFDLILEPARLERKGNRWTFAASTARPLPVTAVIDFLAYVNPYRIATSYGPALQPVLTARIAASASPNTQGLVTTDEDWFFIGSRDVSQGAGDFDARSALGAALPDFLNLAPIKASGWSRHPVRKAHTPPMSLELTKSETWEPGKVLLLPILYYELDLDSNGADRTLAADTDACKAVVNLANRIAAVVDLKPAEQQRLNYYAEQIRLSAELTKDVATVHGHESLEIFRKFMQAEVRFLLAQDDRLRDLVAGPSTQDAYYKTRAEEAAIVQRYKSQAWMAVATMAMGTAAGASGNLASMNAAQGSALSMFGQATSTAANETRTLNSVYDALAGFSMDVTVEGQIISAASHDELRQKLVELLRSRSTPKTHVAPQQIGAASRE